jgi:hypothetical protein
VRYEPFHLERKRFGAASRGALVAYARALWDNGGGLVGWKEMFHEDESCARLLAPSTDAPFPLLLRELDVKVVVLARNNLVAQSVSALYAAHAAAHVEAAAPSACTSLSVWVGNCSVRPPPLALGLRRLHAKMRVFSDMGRRHARFVSRARLSALRVTFESLMTRGRPTLRAVCAWVNAGAACSEELLRALPLRRQSDGEYARALAKRVENVDLLAAAFADTCFAEQFAVAYPRQPCASRPWAREWD